MRVSPPPEEEEEDEAELECARDWWIAKCASDGEEEGVVLRWWEEGEKTCRVEGAMVGRGVG